METRDTYQAGQSADDSATSEKVLTMRPYTKKDNAYADRLIGVASPSAYYLLDYLIRQTVGFHRETVRYSSKQLATVTKLSQRTIFTAIRELETLHVIAKDAGDMGRTQIRTFRLLSADEWRLPERDTQTTAKFAVVEKRKRTTAKNTVDGQTTTAKFAEGDTQTTANFADLIKKEESKEKREKENDSDANASAERDTAPATPEKPTRQKRKLSPEARERHNAEAAYVSDLCKRQLAALKCGKSPKPGEDRAGGHGYYTAGQDGAPADPEQVIALLRVVKQSPHYSGQYLTLQATIRYWPEWLLDPKNVRDSIAVERRKADYARAAANGHKAQRPAGREQTYAKTGEDMAPKGWS